MNIFLAFHDGDAQTASNLLTWLNQIGGMAGCDFYFVMDPDTDSGLAMMAKKIGKPKAMFFLDQSVKGWIPGSNALWLKAAEEAQKIGEPWLFLEPDAVPTRQSWAIEIQAEYRRIGKPYMGALIEHKNSFQPSPYLEGCSVYPATAFSEIGAMVKPDKSWTLSTASYVVPKAANSPLFQHLWGEMGKPPVFGRNSIPGTNVFGIEFVRAKTALFHRNKDGSLIGLLRERIGIKSLPKSGKPIIQVRRTSAIGDVLCASAVCERLIDLGFNVSYQIGAASQCVIKRHRTRIPVVPPSGNPEVNLDGAYENDPRRKHKHFHECFFDVANQQLKRVGIDLGLPLNCTPRIVATPDRSKMAGNGPFVLIIPKSNEWANRTIPNPLWQQIAQKVSGTCLWGGTQPAPVGITDLNIRHLDTLIETIAGCDLVVSVDTGPMHIAAALNVPLVVVNQSSFAEHHLSDQNDYFTVDPKLACLNCQEGKCHINPTVPPCQNIDPNIVADAINRRIHRHPISCVISVYKPPSDRLNRCLSAVINQVDEIVVCRDLAGVFPQGAMKHPKIRYVVLNKSDVGYGRKINFGARQTSGEWIWTLNDDCFVQGDTAARLMDLAAPGVGMIAHELRYPNGLIQHGGTYRNPGDIGWGHLDHNSKESRIKSPVEMENVTGASVLIRRKAFYQANCFDEEFYLYCEDNAMCLQVRKAGWKIMYTPLAKAIHDEHSSTKITPNMRTHLLHSQAVLKRKWGWYFDYNRERTLGIFP